MSSQTTNIDRNLIRLILNAKWHFLNFLNLLNYQFKFPLPLESRVSIWSTVLSRMSDWWIWNSKCHWSASRFSRIREEKTERIQMALPRLNTCWNDNRQKEFACPFLPEIKSICNLKTQSKSNPRTLLLKGVNQVSTLCTERRDHIQESSQTFLSVFLISIYVIRIYKNL